MNHPSLITGGVVGGIIGLTGSVLSSALKSMNGDPFLIFALPGQLLRLLGAFGCSWKSSYCESGDLAGYIITVISFILLGVFTEWTVYKIRSRPH
ncbi:MAG: hypothetical protein HGA85_06905 [Nanoarchaeota archaeon]|nr:hypothetical protein [Nanoarchaeota archaeon]